MQYLDDSVSATFTLPFPATSASSVSLASQLTADGRIVYPSYSPHLDTPNGSARGAYGRSTPMGAGLFAAVAAVLGRRRAARGHRRLKAAALDGRKGQQEATSGSSALRSSKHGSSVNDSDLLLRVARGDRDCGRTPVWLMRQAGRYMTAFREYSDKYPFRLRSETPAIATELSLQCWRKFGMDGVIVFSDILTVLPAMGIEFDVVKGRGPVVFSPETLAARLSDPVATIKAISEPDDFSITHGFLHETLSALRKETEGRCSLLGFVGAPWTLAAYAVEGGSTDDSAATFKRWMFQSPELADELLTRIADTVASYAIFQIRSGAQCVQLFDSWAHCLTPEMWSRFAAPHVKKIAARIHKAYPDVPVIYFAHGGSSYLPEQLEELAGYVQVLAVDAGVRMAEAAAMAEGSGIVLQGNVDPFVLRYGSEKEIRAAARRCIDEAGGPGRHILNLGHGVQKETPEDAVQAFVDEALTYHCEV